MNHDEILKDIENKIRYAAVSFNSNLMYEVHGMVKAYATVGALKASEAARISGRICHDWLNNGRWLNFPDYCYNHMNDKTTDELKAYANEILNPKGYSK